MGSVCLLLALLCAAGTAGCSNENVSLQPSPPDSVYVLDLQEMGWAVLDSIDWPTAEHYHPDFGPPDTGYGAIPNSFPAVPDSLMPVLLEVELHLLHPVQQSASDSVAVVARLINRDTHSVRYRFWTSALHVAVRGPSRKWEMLMRDQALKRERVLAPGEALDEVHVIEAGSGSHYLIAYTVGNRVPSVEQVEHWDMLPPEEEFAIERLADKRTNSPIMKLTVRRVPLIDADTLEAPRVLPPHGRSQ